MPVCCCCALGVNARVNRLAGRMLCFISTAIASCVVVTVSDSASDTIGDRVIPLCCHSEHSALDTIGDLVIPCVVTVSASALDTIGDVVIPFALSQ
jgi:hypothetical protein